MRRSGRRIARYLANNSPDAACHRLGHWWAEQEANHRAAPSDAAAAAAAEPALRLCARCPLQTACADWATTFAYTGLAAGAAYRYGQRTDTDEDAEQVTTLRLRASRDIIARHLARTLLDATCADHARWWTQWEAAHTAATSPETRDDAARPAFALCACCDALDVCATWAEIDTYTGLAAGAAYRKGSRVDHTLRYGRPERRGRRRTGTLEESGTRFEQDGMARRQLHQHLTPEFNATPAEASPEVSVRVPEDSTRFTRSSPKAAERLKTPIQRPSRVSTGIVRELDSPYRTYHVGMTQEEEVMGLWGIVTESRAHTLIHVRDLTTEELRRLRDCEQRLNLFAESSPMEVAAALFADFDQAQNHAATTHSSSAISHSVSLAQRTAEQLIGLRELWRASIVEAGMEASRCTSLAQENEIAATLKKLETVLAESSVSWGVKEGSLAANLPDGSLVVQEVLAKALKSAERLTLSLVVDLRDELDEACLFVRKLAAEVLLGDPVVMRGPGVDSISPSPLPLGPATHVQRLKVMADRLTRQRQGRDAESPSRSARADGYAAGRTSSADGETPLADDAAPPKPTRKSPAPLPPASVTLEFLVDQLGRGLDDLLTAWSASVSVQDLGKDQQRLQAITAAIGHALLRESGAEGNTVVLPQFPPQMDVLANLDLADSKVRASWTWLGRLLLMQELASLVGQVAALRGIEFVSGRVTKLSLRPNVIQQANELAQALSSCLADDPTNARVENLRLAERAFANGMPEAALLYGLYAIGDEVDDTLRNRAWELLSKVATEDAAPRGCIVPYARFLSDLAQHGVGSSD